MATHGLLAVCCTFVRILQLSSYELSVSIGMSSPAVRTRRGSLRAKTRLRRRHGLACSLHDRLRFRQERHRVRHTARVQWYGASGDCPGCCKHVSGYPGIGIGYLIMVTTAGDSRTLLPTGSNEVFWVRRVRRRWPARRRCWVVHICPAHSVLEVRSARVVGLWPHILSDLFCRPHWRTPFFLMAGLSALVLVFGIFAIDNDPPLSQPEQVGDRYVWLNGSAGTAHNPSKVD